MRIKCNTQYAAIANSRQLLQTWTESWRPMISGLSPPSIGKLSPWHSRGPSITIIDNFDSDYYRLVIDNKLSKASLPSTHYEKEIARTRSPGRRFDSKATRSATIKRRAHCAYSKSLNIVLCLMNTMAGMGFKCDVKVKV